MEDFEIADAIEAGHNTARTVAIRFGISVSAAAKLVAKFSKKYPQAITTEWRQVKNQAHAQELVYTMKERPCLPTSVTEMEEPSPAAIVGDSSEAPPPTMASAPSASASCASNPEPSSPSSRDNGSLKILADLLS